MQLRQISAQHYEVRCSKCMDFAWGNTADLAVRKWNEIQGKEDNPNISATQPKTVKDCCKNGMNLIDQKTGQSDKRILVCCICGCKHIRFKADPGEILGKFGR